MGPQLRHRAVALGEAEPNSGARVLAKGYGDLAEQIIDEARRHDIYVHDAPELVDLLMQVDLDERIPARLYEVIAQLLAWIAGLDAEVDSDPP